MKLIECTYEAHAAPILGILNDAIVHTTALYEYQPRPFASMRGWFDVKARSQYPVLGAIDGDGLLLGFASYGPFRPHAAYKYSIEHSIYVHRDHRGRGIGRTLLGRLLEVATEQQYHVMIGGIDRDNVASIALHEKHGFEAAGIIRHAAYKFGRWLDLAFYQRVLTGPRQPIES
jgi:phosphinothricin acetyltransferase